MFFRYGKTFNATKFIAQSNILKRKSTYILGGLYVKINASRGGFAKNIT